VNILKLLWIPVFFFVGCSPLTLAAPSESPQPVQLWITPTAQKLLYDAINACSGENSGISLIQNLKPDRPFEWENADVSIMLGEPDGGVSEFSALLGWEDIVIVAHHELDTGTYDADVIRQVYTQYSRETKVWTYPEGHELRRFFEKTLIKDVALTPGALIAPGADQMQNAIQGNPNSIGYLPKSWMTKDLQAIKLDPSIQSALRLPILAITQKAPSGPLEVFLGCLQNYEGQGLN